MKKVIFFSVFVVCSLLTSFAQDKVYLHNGTIAKGKVVANEPSYIKLQYDGEDVASTLGKAAIEKIEFLSGRVEQCTQKVIIEDPSKEYGKIQVLRDKEDCVGLVRVQEFTEKSGGMWSIGTTAGQGAPRGYVDLGLPSGTYWKECNESGFFTFDGAVQRFGNKLPSRAQWQELKDYCEWQWTGSGCKVIGTNGKSMVLPAAGYRGCEGSVSFVGSWGNYWSSAPDGSDRDRAWVLFFTSGGARMDSNSRCFGYSVRLVQD